MLTTPLRILTLAAATSGALAQPATTPPEAPKAPAAKDAAPTTAPTQPNALAAATPQADPAAEKFWRRDDVWTARIEPAAWYTGLSARLKMPRALPTNPGGNHAFNVHQLNQDTGSRLSPFGEVNIRKGDYAFTIRAFHFGSDRDATGVNMRIGDIPVHTGDSLNSSVDFTGIDAEFRYTILPTPDKKLLPGKARLRPRVDLMGGIRMYDSSWDVENRSLTTPTGTDSNESHVTEFFITPVVGVKGSVELYDRFTIDGQIAIGGMPWGEQTSLTGDVLVGGTWKPWDNFGVQVGYRALFFGLSSGNDDQEYEFRASYQGLYFGIVLEF